MGLNVFDIINAALGIISAVVPLVQVPLAIKADQRRAKQPELHMIHRQTRHKYKR